MVTGFAVLPIVPLDGVAGEVIQAGITDARDQVLLRKIFRQAKWVEMRFVLALRLRWLAKIRGRGFESSLFWFFVAEKLAHDMSSVVGDQYDGLAGN